MVCVSVCVCVWYMCVCVCIIMILFENPFRSKLLFRDRADDAIN